MSAQPIPPPSADYDYRKNEDGTFDSICLHCFLMVGAAKTIDVLHQAEAQHNCFAKKQASIDRIITAS